MGDGFTVNNFEHLADQGVAVYGLYDTVDNCWLGTEMQPKLFTREDSIALNGLPLPTLAQIAAQMAGVQLGYHPGRIQAREFHAGELTLKDEVPTKMTALEALKKLEGE